jgi:hypothetical protein
MKLQNHKQMKKILLLCTILLVAILGTSCLSDDLYPTPDKPGTGAEGFTLDVKFQGTTRNTRSTVEALPGERSVYTLHLLFFSTEDNEQYIDYVKLGDGVTPMNMSAPIKIEYKPGSTLSHSTAYRILIVANIESYVSSESAWLTSFEGVSYNSAQVRALDLQYAADNGGIKRDRLLMSVAVDRDPTKDEIEATLTRAVTRFDVHLSTETHMGAFSLANASVWNVPTTTSIWNSALNNYSTHIGRFSPDVPFNNPRGEEGMLYAVENTSVSILQNDTKTTAIIIGIIGFGNPDPTYYRVNVAGSPTSQSLLRNSAYNIEIRNVSGPGAATPEAAYESSAQLLDIKINNWTVGEHPGLIIVDGENIVALPTDHIFLRPEANNVTYNIFTHSPDPQVGLGLSRVSLPEGINIVLIGNELRITHTASLQDRTGEVELAFGNIRTVIKITQTGSDRDYLDLSRAIQGENGIPTFPADNAQQMAGNVIVTAAGSWTAQIHGDEFTFVSGLDVKTATGAPGGTFRVSTTGANSSPDIIYGFITVTLDRNPEIRRVLVVRQAGSGEIVVSPNLSVLNFNANMTPVEVNTFEAYAGDGVAITAEVVGENASRFHVASEGMSGQNYVFTVTAVTENGTGSIHNATLRFSAAGMSATRTIPLRQTSYQITVTPPATTPNIAITGGTTGMYRVTSATPWTASVTTTGTGGGRSLVQHEATLNITGDGFTVTFPKVYYPNREIPIVANVTITAGTLTQTVLVQQNALNSKGFNIAGYVSTGTGGINGGVFATGVQAFTTIPGYALVNRFTAATNNAARADVTYIHVSNQGRTATWNWGNINDRRASNEALFWITTVNGTGPVAMVNSATSPLSTFPNVVGRSGGANSTLNASAATTKVYQFLTSQGNTPFSSAGPFIVNGAHTTMPMGGLPNGAVPLLIKGGTNDATLVICPVTRIIYLGESDHFGTTAQTNNPNVRNFLDNLMFYVGNAAKYGSHFTDMFIEATHPSGRGVPAPWDAHWGDNTGVPSK